MFEEKCYIIAQLSLDSIYINDAALDDPYGGVEADGDDDPVDCSICKGPPSVGNPVVKCDGEHVFEIGYHMQCLPKVPGLDGQLGYPALPDDGDDWLCPDCIAKGLYIIKEITGKRMRSGKTQYGVLYAGDHAVEWCDFAYLRGIPHAKLLITKYNAAQQELQRQ